MGFFNHDKVYLYAWQMCILSHILLNNKKEAKWFLCNFRLIHFILQCKFKHNLKEKILYGCHNRQRVNKRLISIQKLLSIQILGVLPCELENGWHGRIHQRVCNCNYGTDAMGLTNLFLIGFKTHSIIPPEETNFLVLSVFQEPVAGRSWGLVINLWTHYYYNIKLPSNFLCVCVLVCVAID